MTLDVEIPDPPTLSGPQDPGDYDAVDEPDERTGDDTRREELADFLAAGAWEDVFDEWAAHTYLTEDEFRAVRELGLLDELDFYWNPAAADVGYRAPAVPAELPETHDDLDADDIEDIEEELDDLARMVSEALETDYIHRDAEEFGYDWG
ncbi:hypothetical protein [Natrinema salifodinae]|uniref:DUF7992 domain-containing protein n=1 Tax=Natrinema salifodinae TaxID=1202768 RepID=A0A1I0MZM9_9EURY|nr:hypothetical protein [Natrinema salifodinae]SEV94280.1 hypothetical protein SAMN05216285_1186 [Natrinema salifodinae]